MPLGPDDRDDRRRDSSGRAPLAPLGGNAEDKTGAGDEPAAAAGRLSRASRAPSQAVRRLRCERRRSTMRRTAADALVDAAPMKRRKAHAIDMPQDFLAAHGEALASFRQKQCKQDKSDREAVLAEAMRLAAS
jgi:hypothetical protein